MGLFGNIEESVLGKKSLVIYFSRADENYFGGAMKYIDKGNTEVIAEYIKEITGADLFKVERKIPYSANYKTCTEESAEEQRTNARPELVNYLDNIDDYEVIYIGYPIYWGTMPNPMFTQLEKLNWNGKIVKCFSTHEGSGLGSSESDIKRICKGATILSGIAINGSSVNSSKEKIEKWIR